MQLIITRLKEVASHGSNGDNKMTVSPYTTKPVKGDNIFACYLKYSKREGCLESDIEEQTSSLERHGSEEKFIRHVIISLLEQYILGEKEWIPSDIPIKSVFHEYNLYLKSVNLFTGDLKPKKTRRIAR